MRVPDLGSRGQGWVLLQLVLMAFIALAGAASSVAAGPAGTVLIVAGGTSIVTGGVMAYLGSRALGRSFTPDPRPLERAQLVETGIYASVRHPIYGGVTLGALGWGLLNGSPLAIALSGVLLLVFYLKSIREEAWLVERYPAYADYRRRTGRFFPRLVAADDPPDARPDTRGTD